MWSLVLRNLFFTVLQPGLVAGLFPYLLLGSPDSGRFTSDLHVTQYIAILLFLTGTAVLLYCIGLFAVKGKGTLSPADPTKKLVATGLYRYSRNPMYLGVLLILIGESLFFGSALIWLYTVMIFLAFHLFILVHEEPRLERDFGDEYEQYRKSVRRWL